MWQGMLVCHSADYSRRCRQPTGGDASFSTPLTVLRRVPAAAAVERQACWEVQQGDRRSGRGQGQQRHTP